MIKEFFINATSLITFKKVWTREKHSPLLPCHLCEGKDPVSPLCHCERPAGAWQSTYAKKTTVRMSLSSLPSCHPCEGRDPVLKSLGSFLKDTKGSAILEFAIVSPFLIFLTLFGYEGANLVLVNGKVHDTAFILAHALSSSTVTYSLASCGNICQIMSTIPQYSLGRYNQDVTVTAYGMQPRSASDKTVRWLWVAGWEGVSGKSTKSQYGYYKGGNFAPPAGVLPNSIKNSLVYPQSAVTVKVQYKYKPFFKILFSQETFTAQVTTLTQSGLLTQKGSCDA